MTGNERYALISVTDKTGVVGFAKGLVASGYTILSTGGSAKVLREHDVPVTDVSSYTGSPEILDGRVKTLHPKLHGGILFDRNNPQHAQQAITHGIKPIDIVVVNLYNFQDEAKAKNLSAAEAIHHIDVGGPAMLRAAAKNFANCIVVPSPSFYPAVIAALQQNQGLAELRRELAAKTFTMVSNYDQMIGSYLSSATNDKTQGGGDQSDFFPSTLELSANAALPLRYGENPQQKAMFYTSDGTLPFVCLQGKELSFNNLLDVDAAIELAVDLRTALKLHAISIIKHNSPCGVALGRSPATPVAEIFRNSLLCDSRSAFGGIVASTAVIDKTAAQAMMEIFLECVAASDFTPDALAVFAAKKNLRLIKSSKLNRMKVANEPEIIWRSALGGLLGQESDTRLASFDQWKLTSGLEVKEETRRDLIVADIVAKHAKSNAVAFVKNLHTIAIGCGQTSRIDAATFALERGEKTLGKELLRGSCMGSDAFFPFRDCIDLVAQYGIAAIAQPGGSLRDQESIDAANEHKIALYLTGMRHFRH